MNDSIDVEVEGKSYGEPIRTETAITEFPFPQSEKEYLLFKISHQTRVARNSLLTLALLCILYGGYDIRILNLLGTSLDDQNGNVPTVLFLLFPHASKSYGL